MFFFVISVLWIAYGIVHDKGAVKNPIDRELTNYGTSIDIRTGTVVSEE
jgi:hypothetical protein